MQEQSSDQTPAQAFPLTEWSLVSRARQTDESARRAALSVLLQRYLPALRAHLLAQQRGSSASATHIDDLLQGFVADKIIEQRLLDHAQEAKGKFRSFLLVTLDRYVISQHRSQTAGKRTPSNGFAVLGEHAHQVAGGEPDPAESFNVAWAREMIAEALRRMQADCSASGRTDLWAIFDGRVVRPAFEGREPSQYADLVQQLSLATPLEACRLLTTAKRMFARHLRAVASEHADSGDGSGTGTEAEIEELRNILAGCAAQSRAPLRT